MSPAEIKRIIEQRCAWGDGIRRSGRLVHADKLQNHDGRVLQRRDGERLATTVPASSRRR